jgi:GNAT superfamily N-acetyltransferase
MKEEYACRLANRSDLKALQQVGLLSYGRFKELLGNDHWKIMESNLGNETTYLKLLETATAFVCEKDHALVGMAFLVPNGNPTAVFQADWCYIRLAGVIPDHEGKGIGRTLIEHCIRFAKHSGEHTIALHTSEFQHAARHIYENLGFIRLREIDNTYGKRYFLYTLPLS